MKISLDNVNLRCIIQHMKCRALPASLTLKSVLVGDKRRFNPYPLRQTKGEMNMKSKAKQHRLDVRRQAFDIMVKKSTDGTYRGYKRPGSYKA